MTSTFPALPTHGSNAQTAPECPDSGIPAGSIPPDPSGRSPGALSSLSIVLPCFNEQENVADAIRYALSAAERCATDYEVIVVDDGSTDETARIAAGFVEDDRHVRLRVHAYNRGYGEPCARASRPPGWTGCCSPTRTSSSTCASSRTSCRPQRGPTSWSGGAS